MFCRSNPNLGTKPNFASAFCLGWSGVCLRAACLTELTIFTKPKKKITQKAMTHSTIFKLTNVQPKPKAIPDKSKAHLVVPGQSIASSKFWMRGHGTFVDEGGDVSLQTEMKMDEDQDEHEKIPEAEIRSGLAGTVERINKLVSVRGLRGR